MASRDQHSQQQNQTRKVPFFPLLSLVCFVSVFLLLSSIRKTSVPPRPHNASFEFQKTEGSNPKIKRWYSGVMLMENRTKAGAIKIFRTQSPRHFEGGDWDQGGSCNLVNPLSVEQVEDLFSVKNNGTNVEARLVNQHLYKSLKGSSFQILNITHMSEFKADAHPSTASGKKHDDCMH
ncbi:unnamed protein product [Malus baccata var. baccata]